MKSDWKLVIWTVVIALIIVWIAPPLIGMIAMIMQGGHP